MRVGLALAHHNDAIEPRHMGEKPGRFGRCRDRDPGFRAGAGEVVEDPAGHDGVADHARRHEQDLLRHT